MDWSLIIFIAVVVFFTYRGFRKGLLKALSRILSLVAGYIAAILFTSQFSAVIESQTPLQGLIALIAASVILFFVAGFVVSLVFWVVDKIFPQRENNSTASSIGGATVGLLAGIIIAVIIVWTFALLRDMQAEVELSESVKPKKSNIESIVKQAAAKAVETAFSLANTKPEVTKLGATLVESPAKIAQHAQRLINSKKLNNLLGDPDNQQVLDSGDIEAVKALPAFQQLVNNPDMLALTKSAGMLNESTDNADTVETTLARQLTSIWLRMQRMKNDQRVQEILEDPEFQRKIQSGNPLDLLTNAKLLELADIIFEDNGDEGIVEPGEGKLPNVSKENKTVYSWTDENGRIHYSDKALE